MKLVGVISINTAGYNNSPTRSEERVVHPLSGTCRDEEDQKVDFGGGLKDVRTSEHAVIDINYTLCSEKMNVIRNNLEKISNVIRV